MPTVTYTLLVLPRFNGMYYSVHVEDFGHDTRLENLEGADIGRAKEIYTPVVQAIVDEYVKSGKPLPPAKFSAETSTYNTTYDELIMFIKVDVEVPEASGWCTLV